MAGASTSITRPRLAAGKGRRAGIMKHLSCLVLIRFLGLSFSDSRVPRGCLSLQIQVVHVPQPDGAEYLKPWELWSEFLNYGHKYWYNPETGQTADFTFFDALRKKAILLLWGLQGV